MNRPIDARRLNLEWWLVTLLSSAIVLFFVYDRTTARLDTFFYDLLLRVDTNPPDPRILIVAIDERSLQEVAPWPWPRDVQAGLIRAINRGRPKAIAYDVLLLEPKSGDDQLGKAMAEGAATFVPLVLDSPGLNGAEADPLLPVPDVRRGARGIGHVNLMIDPDGLTRRVRLSVDDSRQQWPHLMELMRRATGSPEESSVPDDRPLLLPFAGSPGHFPTIGAASLLRGEFPPEFMQGRLVLVGVTAQGLGDRYSTPRGDNQGIMSGVEIQAHLLNAMLSRRLITEGGMFVQAALALLCLWILLAGFRSLRPTPIVLLLAALALAILAGTASAFLLFRLWIPPVPALAGLLLTYPLWAWRRLAAMNSYVNAELALLRTEPNLLSAPPALPPGADPLFRQSLLLKDAITRMRDMRRFVSDSLRQLPDPLFVADLDGKTVLANSEAASLVQELRLPSGTEDIRSVLALLKPGADMFTQEGALASGQAPLWPPPQDHVRYEMQAPNGRRFDIDITPRASADGHALGWIVRMMDITAIRTAQRQREDMLEFLSHDMRSPQASILAVIAGAGPAAMESDVARRIEGYAHRTLRLADGFVQLARAETLRYRLEPVNLSDVLLDAIDDVWPQIKAKNLVVETRGEDVTYIVSGERTLLTRAMINLIDNAVRFSPDHGRLTCTLDERDVGGMRTVACSITDQGPGIAAEHLCTLFERFQQAPRQFTGRKDGVGLGLSLVQTVITRHNGRIDCESEPGKRTTFTVALPLIE